MPDRPPEAPPPGFRAFSVSRACSLLFAIEDFFEEQVVPFAEGGGAEVFVPDEANDGGGDGVPCGSLVLCWEGGRNYLEKWFLN